MARFYFTFDNTENTTLGTQSTTYAFDRLSFPSVSNPGPALRTALLNARSALSIQFYSQITTANRDGSLGITVPTDGYVVSGGNIQNDTYPSGPGLYTNTEAIYNSDFRDRPQPPITKSNSTAITSPPLSRASAPWSIPASYYNNCTIALQNVMAAVLGDASGQQPSGGIYARLASVYDKDLTLRSLWHDANMTYFAWDDYTPGTPGALTVNVSTTNVIISGFPGTQPFKMDAYAKIFVSYVGNIDGQGSGSASVYHEFPAGTTQAVIPHNIAGLQNGDPWNQMDIRAYYRLENQAVYPAAFGSGAISVNGQTYTLLNQQGAVNNP